MIMIIIRHLKIINEGLSCVVPRSPLDVARGMQRQRIATVDLIITYNVTISEACPLLTLTSSQLESDISRLPEQFVEPDWSIRCLHLRRGTPMQCGMLRGF